MENPKPPSQFRLRVITSRNDAVYDGAEHLAILAMLPEDIDEHGTGPGVIVADIETGEHAASFARLLAAAPRMFEALQVASNAIRGVLLDETPGSAEHQEHQWVLDVLNGALNDAYGTVV